MADNYSQALDSLRTIQNKAQLQDGEIQFLSEDLEELSSMIEKLEQGRVEISVFGEVSSGKSALLNALLGEESFEVGARCGVTICNQKKEWDIDYAVPDIADSRVLLVDTPGINEVNGEERDKTARNAVKNSDLILFVITGDLTEVEFLALKDLHLTNKPIIVALNKVDVLKDKEKKDVLDELNIKLKGIVQPENIIEVAGAPNKKTVIVQKPDGSEVETERDTPPIVEDLRLRILQILQAEGKDIIAINAALFSGDLDNKVTQFKIHARKNYTDRLVKKYAILKGVGIAVNPIPLADVLGGAAVDAWLIKSIGETYGINVTFSGTQKLGVEVAKALGSLALIELATNLGAAILKITTFGVGSVLVGIPQGMAGAWGTYIVGAACREYYANGASWGNKGAKKVVQEIINNLDKNSIMEELKAGIINRLINKKEYKEDFEKVKTMNTSESDIKDDNDFLDSLKDGLKRMANLSTVTGKLESIFSRPKN